MARAGSRILDAGERLPVVTIDTVTHGRISVPEHFGDGWGVFLIYRAHWCPYCKQQLAAFERAQSKLREEGITVVAASTDPVEKAKETVSEHSLTFPIGYGLPLKETAAALGAFYEERRNILQYSSGPIGRLVSQDILGLVQFYKKSAK